jgi:hypothetical protein
VLVDHPRLLLTHLRHAWQELEDLRAGSGGRVAAGALVLAAVSSLPSTSGGPLVARLVQPAKFEAQQSFLKTLDIALPTTQPPAGISTRREARLSPAADTLIAALRDAACANAGCPA